MKHKFLILVFVQVLDYLTTIIGIHFFGLVETNPIVLELFESPPLFILTQLVLLTMVYISLQVTSTEADVYEYGTFYALFTALSIGWINNTILILHTLL